MLPDVRTLASGNYWSREDAAKRTDCPASIIKRLLGDDHFDVRAAAIAHHRAPIAKLRTILNPPSLADHDRESLFPFALTNPKMTTALIDETITRALNDRTSTKLLSEKRLFELYRHPLVSPTLLSQGINARNGKWALSIAANPALTVMMARRLLLNGSYHVRIKVLGNLNVQMTVLSEKEWDRENSPEVLKLAAMRLDGEPEQRMINRLYILGGCGDWSGRFIAQSTTNPLHLTRLCSDPKAVVRRAAAENPAASESDRVMAALLDLAR